MLSYFPIPFDHIARSENVSGTTWFVEGGATWSGVEGVEDTGEETRGGGEIVHWYGIYGEEESEIF